MSKSLESQETRVENLVRMLNEIVEKDDYKKSYKQFDKCKTVGNHEDFPNRTKIDELLRCNTLTSGDEQTNLKEDIDRMKDGQNDVRGQREFRALLFVHGRVNRTPHRSHFLAFGCTHFQCRM